MLALDVHIDFDNHSLSTQLEVPESGTVGLFGKSGIGKSTLLKVISGLYRPHRGHLSLNGKIWNDNAHNIFLPAQKRSVGMVFQDFALFPNLSVLENLQFAQSIPETELSELVDVLDIKNLLNKKTTSISGGQKQRVAIGRAIAYNPKVLLMDEPFAALDEEIKENIKVFLKEYIKSKSKIAILASHDIRDLEYFTNTIVRITESS